VTSVVRHKSLYYDCHSCGSRNPVPLGTFWIPACAGMTDKGTFQSAKVLLKIDNHMFKQWFYFSNEWQITGILVVS